MTVPSDPEPDSEAEPEADSEIRPPRPWRFPPLLAGSAALHAVGLPVLLAVPGWRWVAAAAMVADHGVLLGAGLLPRTGVLGPNLRRIPASGRRISLSFDDGPDPEVTPRVLDLLDARGARATFFCIGEKVERQARLAAEIARRGHRIENHTHRHLNRFSMLGPGGMGREIDRAQAAIAEVTGRAPELFRAPAGIRSPLLEPVLARRGLWLTSWTRRGYDTVRSDPARVLGALVEGLGAGDLLLLHDGNAARTPAGEPVVLAVLPRLLDRLAADGLEAVPIPVPIPSPGAPGRIPPP